MHIQLTVAPATINYPGSVLTFDKAADYAKPRREWIDAEPTITASSRAVGQPIVAASVDGGQLCSCARCTRTHTYAHTHTIHTPSQKSLFTHSITQARPRACLGRSRLWKPSKNVATGKMGREVAFYLQRGTGGNEPLGRPAHSEMKIKPLEALPARSRCSYETKND